MAEDEEGQEVLIFGVSETTPLTVSGVREMRGLRRPKLRRNWRAFSASPGAAPPTVLSANVAADGNTISILFSKAMSAVGTGGFAITSSSGLPINLSYVTLSGNAFVYNPDRTITTSEVLTLAYAPGNVVAADGGVLAAFSGKSVANSSATANPNLTSSSANGYLLTLNFDQSVDYDGTSPAKLNFGGNKWQFGSGEGIAGSGTTSIVLDFTYTGLQVSSVDSTNITSMTSAGFTLSADSSVPLNVPTQPFAVTNNTMGVDAVSNSGYQTAASTYNWNHTCTGSNLFLAVDLSLLSVAGTTVTGVTCNGVALTNIGVKSSISGACRIESWRLVNPATGTHTIAVTLSAGIASAGTAVSYANVNQTTPTEAFNSAQATNTGSATDAGVVVTSTTDNCWMHAAIATNDTSVTANQTTRNNVTGTLGSGANEDTNAVVTPAGATTLGYTGLGIAATWAMGGYAIRPIGS